MNIILASRSKRREKLLKKAGFKFKKIIPREPNHFAAGLSAKKESMRMAQFKSVWAALKNPQSVVISADTLIECGKKKIGKPKNIKEARKFLKMFSKKNFIIYSSVCITRLGQKQKQICWTDKIPIRCKEIEKKEIESYIKSKKWRGKAGGFNILERPASKWFCADKKYLNTIAGLNTNRIKKEIKKF